jgi:hypothetical protein
MRPKGREQTLTLPQFRSIGWQVRLGNKPVKGNLQEMRL